MSKLEAIQDYLPKIMNLFTLDALLLAGIVLMLIAIIRGSKSNAKLKEKNDRRRRRMDAVYSSDRQDLVRH
jgi:hypothetical protein